MPGGRRTDVPFPRSVGVLAATDPMAQHSPSAALIDRLRHALPPDVALTLYGPLGGRRGADLIPATLRAASSADLAARSELLFVMIDDLDTVESLLSGPSGVQAGVHSPTVLIMSATCQPAPLRDLTGRLRSITAGLLTVVDAPMSTRPSEIRAGQVPILTGAPLEVFVRVEPVLKLLGPTVRVGGVGSGQMAAACTQFLLASNAAVLVETALLAQRSGLDLDRLFASWRAADLPGRMMAEVRERIANSSGGHLPMETWAGPLAVAQAEARRTQTQSTLLTTIEGIYGRAVDDGPPDGDLLEQLLRMCAARPKTTDPSRPTVDTADDPGRDDQAE